jgi:hypothetical protein
LDRRFGYAEKDFKEVFAQQKHRRVIKSHLPLDTLPYHPKAKYVFVARDGRDVAVSLYNHYNDYTDNMLNLINDTPGREGFFFSFKFFFFTFSFFRTKTWKMQQKYWRILQGVYWKRWISILVFM